MSTCFSLLCTICSEFYKSNDEILATKTCGHAFHKSCFEDWYNRSKTCPECRWESPATQRLYLHFEENKELEEKYLQKINELKQQLEESEQNFANALAALTDKDEENQRLKNELEFRKAQNESYETELKKLYRAKKEDSIELIDLVEEETLNNTENKSNDCEPKQDAPPLLLANEEIVNSVQNVLTKLADKFKNITLQSMQTSTSDSNANEQTEAEPNHNSILKKSIFASRFPVDTTESDIKAYIFEKLGVWTGVKVFKFPFPPFRRFCSFKITVPEPIYDIVILPEFWPDNRYITDFIERYNTANI